MGASRGVGGEGPKDPNRPLTRQEGVRDLNKVYQGHRVSPPKSGEQTRISSEIDGQREKIGLNEKKENQERPPLEKRRVKFAKSTLSSKKGESKAQGKFAERKAELAERKAELVEATQRLNDFSRIHSRDPRESGDEPFLRAEIARLEQSIQSLEERMPGMSDDILSDRQLLEERKEEAKPTPRPAKGKEKMTDEQEPLSEAELRLQEIEKELVGLYQSDRDTQGIGFSDAVQLRLEVEKRVANLEEEAAQIIQSMAAPELILLEEDGSPYIPQEDEAPISEAGEEEILGEHPVISSAGPPDDAPEVEQNEGELGAIDESWKIGGERGKALLDKTLKELEEVHQQLKKNKGGPKELKEKEKQLLAQATILSEKVDKDNQTSANKALDELGFSNKARREAVKSKLENDLKIIGQAGDDEKTNNLCINALATIFDRSLARELLKKNPKLGQAFQKAYLDRSGSLLSALIEASNVILEAKEKLLKIAEKIREGQTSAYTSKPMKHGTTWSAKEDSESLKIDFDAWSGDKISEMNRSLSDLPPLEQLSDEEIGSWKEDNPRDQVALMIYLKHFNLWDDMQGSTFNQRRSALLSIKEAQTKDPKETVIIDSATGGAIIAEPQFDKTEKEIKGCHDEYVKFSANPRSYFKSGSPRFRPENAKEELSKQPENLRKMALKSGNYQSEQDRALKELENGKIHTAYQRTHFLKKALGARNISSTSAAALIKKGNRIGKNDPSISSSLRKAIGTQKEGFVGEVTNAPLLKRLAQQVSNNL